MPIPPIPITLDKERHLHFSFEALCLLEDVLGIPIADIGQMLQGSVRLGVIRDILYAGLHDEDNTLTRQGVAKLITDLSRLDEIALAIKTAFEGAFAKEPETIKKD